MQLLRLLGLALLLLFAAPADARSVVLPAVAQGRVYPAPALPFGWIDGPPSVNRLLGLLWAGHTLYPAVYPEDLWTEARDFYRRFYRIELDDEQFEALSQ
jgi:iron complex transport system substrate-binding protein